MSTILNKIPIKYKTFNKEIICGDLDICERQFYRIIERYIDCGLVTKDKTIFTTTQLGHELKTLIEAQSPTKQTRIFNRIFQQRNKILDPYKLIELYGMSQKENCTNIINIKYKIMTLNETRERENIQGLFKIFSEPLKQKPEYIEHLVMRYIEISGYQIRNLYGYVQAVLFDLVTCGWKKLSYFRKKVSRASGKILSDVLEYMQHRKIKPENPRIYQEKVAVLWGMKEKVYEAKKRVLDDVRAGKINSSRRKKAIEQVIQDRSASSDFNNSLDSWWNSLDAEQQNWIDSLAAVAHPMLQRANRAEYFRKVRSVN